MLWIIAKKEFLENLLNQRFAISIVLAALIAWMSTFALTKNYNDEVADYYRRVNLQSGMLDSYFHMQAWGGAVTRPPKPPSVLSSLVRGIQSDWIMLGSLDENPVPALSPFMDILFVIGIIMSVAALTLSYDRISGEKEIGTLKLLVIGSYARAKILLGKWLGGILSVVLILLIAFVGSVLIAYILSQSAWTATEWITLGALFFLSALYCTSFYSIGLYISAKTKQPSDSVILALLFWILFTLIIPTLPPYIADTIYPTPSASKLQYELFFKLEQERRDAIRALRAPYVAQRISENEIAEITKAETDKINAEYSRKRHKKEQSAMDKSAVRELITALFHFFSPFSSYALAGAELTATGAWNQVDFIRKASSYEVNITEYLNRKEEEAKKTNSNYTKMTKLDVRDRPRFDYAEEDISHRLAAAAIHSIFVMIYAMLFFVLAWKAFLRYDVR
ncbi:MAG: ABC transporter permease [candidate division KSB1 bacterium]|nr:ABC transporter permease [candidate division KSB1 bacterium]MDZ7365228.1 ABC transporter permease [candidate division KSB1 bacterium]MDZ7407259.1 ABC transporter permease [candidate division KSB1 bacterium]